MLKACGLSISRADGKVLVDNVSLQVNTGESVGLVGESGAGKTLTLRACLGLLPAGLTATAETLEIAGTKLEGLSRRSHAQLLGTTVGFIPQNTMEYLHPLIRVKDQITDGLRTHHPEISRQEAYGLAAQLLSGVDIQDPSRVLDSYPQQLSGGMQQRVKLACALIGNPALVIADEPTAALDVLTQARVLELMTNACAQRGAGMLMVSHNLALVRNYCTRIYVMYEGRIVEQGATQTVCSSPVHWYTQKLLASQPRLDAPCARTVQAAVGRPVLEPAGTAGAAEQDNAAGTLESGGALQTPRQTAGHTDNPAPVILEGRRLTCDFTGHSARSSAGRNAGSNADSSTGGKQDAEDATAGNTPEPGWIRALDNVDCRLHAGECLGVVGVSGSGKSTLGSVMGGLMQPGGGTVLWHGQDLQQLDRGQRRDFRQAVQFIFQDPVASMNPAFTVAEVLDDPQCVRRQPGQARPGRSVRLQRSTQALERVGLGAGILAMRPRDLSGGQAQRVAIARALLLEPRVLICDECTSALDVTVQAQILDLLLDIQKNADVALLFISHDMSVVRATADRVLVLEAGRVCEEGPTETVLDHPQALQTARLIELARTLGA